MVCTAFVLLCRLDVYVPSNAAAIIEDRMSRMTADQRHTSSYGGIGPTATSGCSHPVNSTSAGCNVLLFVHGGVWSMGEKSQFAKFAFRFASEGLVVVVVQ